MKNPYRPPSANLMDTQQHDVRIRSVWQLLGWALLLYVAVNTVAFLWGFSIGSWELFGDTIEEAMRNHRLGLRVVVWLTATALYWRVATGAGTHRLRDVCVVLALVLATDAILELVVFRVEAAELFDLRSLVRSSSAAACGLLLARLISGPLGRPDRNRARQRAS